MEAIRTIQTVTEGEVHLTLPKSFWGKQVEIIVLATNLADQPPSKGKKSLRGALGHYAKPERMADESNAWLESVKDNHEPD
jgi:hypothetical protein